MKGKIAFFCTDCGNETPKWAGKCPACGSWNTLVEKPAASQPKGGAARGVAGLAHNAPKELSKLETSSEIRFGTGLGELDRVLGGGAVVGSLVLVGGSPGIGKSTLLLQICGLFPAGLEASAAAAQGVAQGLLAGRGGACPTKTLYVSGEESERQIKMRAQRLGVAGNGVFVLSETDISEVLSAEAELKPDILIIDSIQTLYNPEQTSSPGSVAQVKDCTASLMRLSKGAGITTFLVSHVNKEGAIAGPKVLEHMVDCVLYFEGERSMNYRILRAAKNRFGSTNEIGVFEMLDAGLSEVMNPSEMLLSGRPESAPGTCVTCVVEGTRPILAEIQALVSPSSLSMPRRNSNGIEYNRAMMLLAVLQQRGGLRVGGCDAYINVIGGLSIDDTGADLATVLALASAYSGKPLSKGLAAIGEVGLTGELRQVSQANQRLTEAARMGFEACVLASGTKSIQNAPKGLELIQVKNISEAMSKCC